MKQYKNCSTCVINMPHTIINAENHNDFTIVPAKSNTGRQFILKRYGRSYTMCDNGQSHYLNLCESMGYAFGLEPGYYQADIKGDSIYIQDISKEQYEQNNPQQDKSRT